MIPLAALFVALSCSTDTTALPMRATASVPSDSITNAPIRTDSSTATASDSVWLAGIPRETGFMSAAAGDTVPRRRRAVEMSDAAVLRLRIHRYASYTMIPLFAVQAIAGNQLYQADRTGAPRPGWAKNTHSLGAAALGTLFTVNTVTGVWALWDSRANEEGRTRRWIHSALLLASDAGFTYAGIKLAGDAKNSQSGRDQHRNVSYISMGAALAGYAVMLVGNR